MAEEKIRCDDCDRDFQSQEALDMHNSVKHVNPNSPPKKEIKDFSTSRKKARNRFIFIVVAAFVIWGVYTLSGTGEKYDSFSQCLDESGAVMYGAYWCPACLEQKRLLGNSKQIPYLECSLPNRGGQNQLCNGEGIESYPTWDFANDERVIGVIKIEDLESRTGCVFDAPASTS